MIDAIRRGRDLYAAWAATNPPRGALDKDVRDTFDVIESDRRWAEAGWPRGWKPHPRAAELVKTGGEPHAVIATMAIAAASENKSDLR